MATQVETKTDTMSTSTTPIKKEGKATFESLSKEVKELVVEKV